MRKLYNEFVAFDDGREITFLTNSQQDFEKIFVNDERVKFSKSWSISMSGIKCHRDFIVLDDSYSIVSHEKTHILSHPVVFHFYKNGRALGEFTVLAIRRNATIGEFFFILLSPFLGISSVIFIDSLIPDVLAFSIIGASFFVPMIVLLPKHYPFDEFTQGNLGAVRFMENMVEEDIGKLSEEPKLGDSDEQM